MMADTARAKADRELQRMERHLADIYSRCGKELEKKAADFLADFTRLDEQHKKDVDSGTWTQEEYDEWRKNKLLYGQKWDRLIDYAKKELANANKTAIDYINGKTTQVYADSYNHLQEVIDNSNVKGYNFELVDAETVRNLYDNDELMLPHKDLDKEKDQAWNAKAINAEILQGILQGDSIPKIAQRMNNVATKNDVAAVRTARTMITAAENSGRQAGMNKAEEDGIEFWKMWIATSDERTRESHNVLNGQCIPNGEMFVTIDGEELEFPGDWRADGSEVYNCRCTLGTIIKGFNKKKLDEAIEEQQEQQLEIEQQTEVEDNSAVNEYVEQINEIREQFRNSSDPKERDGFIQQAGTIIRERVSEANDNYQLELKAIQEARAERMQEVKALREALKPYYEEIKQIDRSLRFCGNKEEREKLQERADLLLSQYGDMIKRKEELDSVAFKALSEESKIREKARDDLREYAANLILELRECGTDKQESFIAPESGGKNAKSMTEYVRNALSYYPTEWINAVLDNRTRPLKCKETARGHYNGNEIVLSGNDAFDYEETAVHELGHCFEDYNKNIKNADAYFYERRTAGEESKWLGKPYKKTEIGKRDNFMNLYMGKDYGGHSYELVSMGFQYYFMEPNELLDDEDYANHIMGILALC